MDTCSDARIATVMKSRRLGARIYIGDRWSDATSIRLACTNLQFAKILHETPEEHISAGDDDDER